MTGEKNHGTEMWGKTLKCNILQLSNNDYISMQAGSLPFPTPSLQQLRHFTEIPMNENAKAASEFKGFEYLIRIRQQFYFLWSHLVLTF